MPQHAGEREEVGLRCGHRTFALAQQRERGRAYCAVCRNTVTIAEAGGGKCEDCGRKKNKYNTGPRCGACEHRARDGRAA